MQEAHDLVIHITPELDMAIDAQCARDGKTSRDSFIRRKCIEKLENEYKEYSGWVKQGRKYQFNVFDPTNTSKPPTPEEDTLELDEEPADFGSFRDTHYTKFETVRLVIPFPKFVYEQALNRASLHNAAQRHAGKLNPHLAPQFKIYKTVGDWFKDVCFFASFADDSAEKESRKEKLDEFEEQLEKQRKAEEKAVSNLPKKNEQKQKSD